MPETIATNIRNACATLGFRGGLAVVMASKTCIAQSAADALTFHSTMSGEPILKLLLNNSNLKKSFTTRAPLDTTEVQTANNRRYNYTLLFFLPEKVNIPPTQKHEYVDVLPRLGETTLIPLAQTPTHTENTHAHHATSPLEAEKERWLIFGNHTRVLALQKELEGVGINAKKTRGVSDETTLSVFVSEEKATGALKKAAERYKLNCIQQKQLTTERDEWWITAHLTPPEKRAKHVIDEHFATIQTLLKPKVFVDGGKRLLLLVRRDVILTKENRDQLYTAKLNFFSVDGREFSKFSSERRNTEEPPPPPPASTNNALIINIPFIITLETLSTSLSPYLRDTILTPLPLTIAPWTWSAELSPNGDNPAWAGDQGTLSLIAPGARMLPPTNTPPPPHLGYPSQTLHLPYHLIIIPVIPP